MFKLEKGDKTGPRVGRITTPHGIIETPAYVIVGTHGHVRALDPEDLPGTNTQLIISNTFHLWQDLGEEGLNDFPGIHAFMGWSGPVMTDSGGFQVFSFGSRPTFAGKKSESEEDSNIAPGTFSEGRPGVRITEAGVYFSVGGSTPSTSSGQVSSPQGGSTSLATGGGEEHYLDAETSIRIQEQIGADIIVAFDEPVAPNASYEYTEEAMRRTHAWAERSLEARVSKQFIYGVVQGGTYSDLRQESARTIARMGFDGFGIGGTYGDAYGGTKEQTRNMLTWSLGELPADKPRHLFGVGRMEDILDGVASGIDTFDCVIPTREARHARIWTSAGHIDITRSIYSDSREPLEPGCVCLTCSTLTRGDLYQLFKTKDPAGQRSATIHNIFFFNSFMALIRQSIKKGEFKKFRQETLAKLITNNNN